MREGYHLRFSIIIIVSSLVIGIWLICMSIAKEDDNKVYIKKVSHVKFLSKTLLKQNTNVSVYKSGKVAKIYICKAKPSDKTLT